MGSIQNLKLSFQKIKNSIEPIFGTSLLFLEKHFLSILALGLLLIYSGVLWENPILKYDDSSLLSPLRHTQNLKHYFEQIKNGYVLDIQPLRDLTFWIEIQIWDLIALKLFHWTNLAIWFFCLLQLKKILQSFDFKSTLVVVLIIAFHPVAVSSVAWISARKHLLSCLFILLATRTAIFLFQSKQLRSRGLFLIPVFYLMAMLSQPINILWPVGFVLGVLICKPLWFKLRSLWIQFFILTVIAGSMAYLQQTYYSGSSFIFSFVAPKIWEEGNEMSMKILVFGRYFMQLIFPSTPSTTGYYPGHVFGMIGLIFGPLSLWLSFKFLNKKILFLALCFLVLPLLVVTIRMTSIYGVDTYLLTPLMAFAVWLALCLDRLHQNFPKSLGFLILMPVLLVPLSWRHAFAWRSDRSIAERAVELENTPSNLNMLAHEFLGQKKWTEALELGIRMMNWTGKPDHRAVHIIGLALIGDPLRSWQEKYRILVNYAYPGFPPFESFRAMFLMQMDRVSEALDIYTKLVDNYSEVKYRASLMDTDKLLKDILLVCDLFPKEKACPDLLEKVKKLQAERALLPQNAVTGIR